MSHLRSGFAGVSVPPIGADGSSHNTITNNVVINKTDKKPDKDGVKEVSDGVYVVYPKGSEDEANPYKNLNERNLETAEARLQEVKRQALSIIIDILYNNPLYVNRFVVAQIDTLKELIKLLTDADSIDITLADPTCDCGCCGTNTNIATIDSIYVSKNNSVLEFKYVYAEAKQILEQHHISMKLVALA